MNAPRIRLSQTAILLILMIVASVVVALVVKDVWMETSPFRKVSASMIQWIWLGGLIMLITTAMIFFKSPRVIHDDGTFTWAPRKIDKIAFTRNTAGRATQLDMHVIPHDGFRAMFVDKPGMGQHGGWEMVLAIKGMLLEKGDNLVINSIDRTVYIGEEAHAALGEIFERLVDHSNTIGAKITDDTPIFLSLIPGPGVNVPPELLTHIMELSEANKVYGEKVAIVRKNLKVIKREMESTAIRAAGPIAPPKTVNDVRDPNMETER